MWVTTISSQFATYLSTFLCSLFFPLQWNFVNFQIDEMSTFSFNDVWIWSELVGLSTALRLSCWPTSPWVPFLMRTFPWLLSGHAQLLLLRKSAVRIWANHLASLNLFSYLENELSRNSCYPWGVRRSYDVVFLISTPQCFQVVWANPSSSFLSQVSTPKSLQSGGWNRKVHSYLQPRAPGPCSWFSHHLPGDSADNSLLSSFIFLIDKIKEERL